MTLPAQTIKSVTAEAYAELDALSDEFDRIQAAHPEIWDSNLVRSAFDYFTGKLKGPAFDSLASAAHSIYEITKAHAVLNNAAIIALEGKL